ncbi:hypothetical protein R3P38DRAFT_3056369 [Favolaschia claudopus]|uniref:DUF4185 domain-containing protein n=1 Tax=Favolaschia claudopus TaxID=2862362 RepID=A0AAW0A310_9AGAR
MTAMSSRHLSYGFIVFSCILVAAARTVTPEVASITNYGSVLDQLNRDSCSSSRWTPSVVLWTCRDSQTFQPDGNPVDPSIANTASFSTLPSSPRNPQNLTLSPPQNVGELFYKLEADECPPLGLCGDSRWVGWPDTGPVVTSTGVLGAVNAYAFIARQQLSGLAVVQTDGYSLYRVTSAHAGPQLPTTKVEVSAFWSRTEIGYGSAGSVLHNGYAYLYGATPNRKLAVARAKLGLFGRLEDKKAYEYWVNGAWTRNAPLLNDTSIVLENTSAIQGTIYWSPKWESFVWIGGDFFPNANFYVSTSPKAEGPWTPAQLFYSGAVGNGSLPAYSAIAHPSLTDGTGNYIFLTWTKTRPAPNGADLYDTPLVRVDWK